MAKSKYRKSIKDVISIIISEYEKSELKKICKRRNREKAKMMFFRWKKNWPTNQKLRKYERRKTEEIEEKHKCCRRDQWKIEEYYNKSEINKRCKKEKTKMQVKHK